MSWPGFLQQVVYQVSRGYFFYSIITYPEHKKEKWFNIDRKLLAKYSADISKDQRYRRKAKKLACFYFLRWEQYVVVLHTPGLIEGVTYDDKFWDVRKNPLRLPLNLEYKMKWLRFLRQGDKQ